MSINVKKDAINGVAGSISFDVRDLVKIRVAYSYSVINIVAIN